MRIPFGNQTWLEPTISWWHFPAMLPEGIRWMFLFHSQNPSSPWVFSGAHGLWSPASQWRSSPMHCSRMERRRLRRSAAMAMQWQGSLGGDINIMMGYILFAMAIHCIHDRIHCQGKNSAIHGFVIAVFFRIPNLRPQLKGGMRRAKWTNCHAVSSSGGPPVFVQYPKPWVLPARVPRVHHSISLFIFVFTM